MTDDIKKDKSPNCPKIALEEAIGLIKSIHEKAGRSKVKREVAASILGYSGMSGSALTVLGALNQYGLIDQDRGTGTLSVSPLALQLIHPISGQQAFEAKVVSALSPKVFNLLYTEGFHHSTEDVLVNHLVQTAFTPETARKVARVYLENISFANLLSPDIRGPSDAKKDESKSRMESGRFMLDTVSRELLAQEAVNENRESGASDFKDKAVLASYSVPLGANEATITFKGVSLSVEDFDALVEYVELFKKQFERKRTSMKDLVIDAANEAMERS